MARSDDARRMAANLFNAEARKCADQHMKAQRLADAGHHDAAEAAYEQAEAMRRDLKIIEDALGG